MTKTHINNRQKSREANGNAVKGTKNPNYKKLNHIELIIALYFSCMNDKEIITIYNKYYNIQITINIIRRVRKILNFPVNHIYRNKKLKLQYLNFIEENKDKIQWYIDNYERLEDEYWINK